MNNYLKKIILIIPFLGKIIKDRDQLLIERNALSQQIGSTSNQTHNYDKLLQINNELLYAHIFSDSIKDSSWLKNKSFSPYQGAANYSFLYKLFRIYDVIQPKNILEFGLGQTTKLTYHYTKYKNKSSKALVIDDNQQWIDIYKKETINSKNFLIKRLDTTSFTYKGIITLASKYANLNNIIKKEKFDLIIIDGPIGYDKEYPRTNILDLIKNNLSNKWIIIIDDTNRSGEQNTINLMVHKLQIMNIKFYSFTIEGSRQQTVLCSLNIHKLVYAI